MITPSSSNGQGESGFGLKSFISGILISYIITLPIFAIFAIVLCFMEFPVKMISPVVIITTIISLLASGYFSSKGMTSKGWLNGALAGLFYMIILYLAGSLILSNFVINRYVITTAFMSVVAGAIGGMAGMNYGHAAHNKTSGKYINKLTHE